VNIKKCPLVYLFDQTNA